MRLVNSSRTSFSLLVSEEKFDDGVGFEIHLVHVGVLVLHHLNTERQTDIVRTQSTSDRNIKKSHIFDTSVRMKVIYYCE